MEIKNQSEEIDDAIRVVVADGDVIIYLIGAVDKEKEAKRTEKRKIELAKVIAGIKNKLANKDFIKRAPKAVVQKEKDRLAGFEKEIKELIKQ